VQEARSEPATNIQRSLTMAAVALDCASHIDVEPKEAHSHKAISWNRSKEPVSCEGTTETGGWHALSP
jgi:hypothetical protein